MKTIRQAHGKIGIFDSGVGGLVVARAIRRSMPGYDYVYFGDTKRVPYGNRSHEVVYQYTKEAVEYLFHKENCAVVILACNTASARALRRLQLEYLPHPSPLLEGEEEIRRILGVLIPSAEECKDFKKIGVIGTRGTVASNTFVDEIKKINSECKVYQNQAPMLVPLAEEGEIKEAVPFLKKYLKPLLAKGVEAIVLGCTHYPIFKNEIRKIVNKKIKIISQDEVVPKKLKDYLSRHHEIEKNLSHTSTAKILVTDITPQVAVLAKKWFGKNAKPELVEI